MTPNPTTIRLRNRLTLSYVDQGDRSAPAVVLLPRRSGQVARLSEAPTSAQKPGHPFSELD